MEEEVKSQEESLQEIAYYLKAGVYTWWFLLWAHFTIAALSKI